jgi:hypothetical protein
LISGRLRYSKKRFRRFAKMASPAWPAVGTGLLKMRGRRVFATAVVHRFIAASVAYVSAGKLQLWAMRLG